MVDKKQALVKWEDELAKQAQEAAKQEANTGGGGQFFSLKAGKLTFNDAPLPDNQMAVVILDSVIENVFYAEAYDSDNPTSPSCFAFGRDESEIAPHPECEKAESDLCASCPMNQWGSAERGKGKACRNRRRLALIPAGQIQKDGTFVCNENVDQYACDPIAYLAVPPTSLGSFGGYVKQLASGLKRPPHGVFTLVSVVPDAKTQFKLVFTSLGLIPNELMPTIMERNKEARSSIESPYQKTIATPKKQVVKSKRY